MRVLRFGPSIVFIKPLRIGEDIENLFRVKPMPFDKALGESQEFETILVPADVEEGTPFDADRSVYLIRERADIVFKEIINAGLPVERIIVEAKHIILRVPANPEKAAEDIVRRYRGKRTGFAGGLMEGEERDTLILITTKKLNSPLKMEDIDEGILVKRPFMELYRDLVVHLPIIMHKTMPEGWNEITIKVYDTEKRYEANLERLFLVIEDLDWGFVVSEGWDWDYPRPFMRVPIYKLKLITWEKPERVKFLLKGLEYSGYRRFCDIDVFLEGKKISWVSIARGLEKFELAKKAREELESLLSPGVLENLHEIEKELTASES